jgi:hypothetical protein
MSIGKLLFYGLFVVWDLLLAIGGLLVTIGMLAALV